MANELNGFLIIDKPQGITSAKAVGVIKRHLPKGVRIGHTGTLDPNVTGVLVTAIGKATKAINYLECLEDSSKVYTATMKFGLITDTLDIWGEVIQTADVPAFTYEDVVTIMSGMMNHYEQVPPMYSALKHNGKRLYELARENIEVERKLRSVYISEFRDIVLTGDELKFTVYCSRGTYIRSLCADIAVRLGTIGVMTSLKRSKKDVFYLEDSITLDEIVDECDIESNLITINHVFRELPKINLNLEYARHVLNGVNVDLRRFLSKTKCCKNDLYFRVKYMNNCIALAALENEEIVTKVRFYDVSELDILE